MLLSLCLASSHSIVSSLLTLERERVLKNEREITTDNGSPSELGGLKGASASSSRERGI